MPRPVANNITDSMIAATHSSRSCPYWCFSSGALLDSFIPIITIIVSKTSAMECTASDISALDFAKIPANSFASDKKTFAPMLSIDALNAIRSFVFNFLSFIF